MKLLKFYGTYCNPCKSLTKIINEIEFKDNFSVVSCDVEDEWELADRFKIKSVPTCVLIDENENEVKRWVGTFNVKEELKDFIE